MCSLLLTKEILLNLYCSTMKHILGIALPFSIAATPLAQLPTVRMLLGTNVAARLMRIGHCRRNSACCAMFVARCREPNVDSCSPHAPPSHAFDIRPPSAC